jgi:hypothetical protein
MVCNHRRTQLPTHSYAQFKDFNSCVYYELFKRYGTCDNKLIGRFEQQTL